MGSVVVSVLLIGGLETDEIVWDGLFEVGGDHVVRVLRVINSEL